MNEDKMLRRLARLSREEDMEMRLDRRWDELAAGLLDDDAARDLREEARSSEKLGAAYEAFRPLGDDFRDETVGKILAARTASAQRPDNTVAFPARARKRSRVPMALAAGLVAAFAIGVTMMRPPELDALPEYTAQLRGGASLRSDTPAAEIVYETGDRFELVLTPATAVEETLGVSLYLDVDGELQPLATPPAQFSPLGAARVTGRVGTDVLLPPGQHQVVVVLGRAGGLPDRETLARNLQDRVTTGGDWSAQRLTIRMEP